MSVIDTFEIDPAEIALLVIGVFCILESISLLFKILFLLIKKRIERKKVNNL